MRDLESIPNRRTYEVSGSPRSSPHLTGWVIQLCLIKEVEYFERIKK
jgi:hypothetical protein